MKWQELSPQNHPFDLEYAKILIRQIVMGLKVHEPIDHQAMERALTAQLVNQFGSWISLWSWSVGEGGGGGPIKNWCCGTHSLFPSNEKDREKSILRVIDAVSEWRNFLSDLSLEF